jgi:hypothetical protein
MPTPEVSWSVMVAAARALVGLVATLVDQAETLAVTPLADVQPAAVIAQDVVAVLLPKFQVVCAQA